MDIKTLQRYIRKVRRQTGSTVQYFRLAFEGNKIERLTDFVRRTREGSTASPRALER